MTTQFTKRELVIFLSMILPILSACNGQSNAVDSDSEVSTQAQTEAKRSSTRSINLNGDWTEEELTEEEQLVAEMMEADGNTVDFKA